MKNLYLILFVLAFSVHAGNNIQITAQVDNQKITLNTTETGHVFGNVMGYFSTCHRYERVVSSQPYNFQTTLKAFNRIKTGDHLSM